MNRKILPEIPSVSYELHRYGDRKLPFILHEDRYRVPAVRNVHENPEFLWFTEGTGQVLCGEERYAVSPGALAVIPSGAVHQVLPEGELVCCCLIVERDFLLENGFPTEGVLFPRILRDEKAEEALLRIRKEDASADLYSVAGLRSAVLKFLLHLYRTHGTKTAPEREPEAPALRAVRIGVEYVKSHLSEKITLDQVAAAAGLSKYYFLRKFRQITGVTVTDYVNRLRCEYAKEFLQRGTYSSKEVASLCGFESVSYFSSVFKKYTGAKPSDYKKNR